MKCSYKTIHLDADFGIFSGTSFDTEKYESTLNELGKMGWKLVSAFTVEKVKGGTKCVVATLVKETSE